MAGSLDELIRFLLDEIALSGQQGCTPADVLDFVSRFYNVANEEVDSSKKDTGQARRSDSPTIDRAFQERVWTWLTKHPDVQIGRDRRGNKMSLSAVEAQYITKSAEVNPEAARRASMSKNLQDPRTQQHQITLNASQLETPEANALRVYVTEERMWLALCGHSQDVTKVFETEFALLSIIAAHREAGILQGDLVKKSGQDKRSVPKRTDVLRNKGYIEKLVVHLKGLKTSRLVFRKFASNGSSDLITPKSGPGGSNGNVQDEFLDFNVLIRGLFAILKEKQIVTRDDLKKELEMKTEWRARILARMVRKLEVLGCLKRVKAASEASKDVRYYFDCVKLIHEPSERDLKAFHASGKHVTDLRAAEERDLEDEDDTCQAMAGRTAGASSSQLEEVDRVVPQWNPDRSLPNALLQLIHQAGMQGFTNRELRHHIMGTFVRRPLEHLLTRLTTLWLQSQPSHLRHLAIVRDTILSGTIPLYVQYSFPNFEARVASGQAFWEAVKLSATESEKKGKKRPTTNTAADSTDPELDEFGFPANYAPVSQYKGARATLGQCLLAAQPEDLPLSSRDPIIFCNGSKAYSVRYDGGETSPSLVTPVTQEALIGVSASPSLYPPSTTKKPSQLRRLGKKPIGRPRKFLRGTEKFWQGQFAMAKAFANPEKHSLVGSKAGVMTDPAGLSLFTKRPPQFDPALVRALESGLPVPTKPKDVTQEWVDKTLQILNRCNSGVYITPKGVRLQGSVRHRNASRLLIFRSSRLGELDFSGQRELPAVRFLASSAAHTFADLRNEFLGEMVVDSEDDVLDSPSSRVRAVRPARDLEPIANGRQAALSTPISHTLSSTVGRDIQVIPEANVAIPSSEEAWRGKSRKNAEITEYNRASPTLSAPVSHSRAGPEIPAWQATPTRPFGLPPPLTTRPSLQKKKTASQVTLLVKEVHEVPVAAATHKSDDRAAIFGENAAAGIPRTTQTYVDKVPVLQDIRKVKPRSGKQSTPVAIINGSSPSNKEKVPGARQDVLDIPRQAADHLESWLGSPRQLLVEPQTAELEATIVSEKPDVIVAGSSHSDSLNIDERDSEAFRLVQELTANLQEEPNQANHSTAIDDYQQRAPTIASPDSNGLTILPELRIADVDSDQERPRKRNKQDGVGGGSVAVLRRKIVLDLLEACSGALPYYQNSLWTAFTAAWQKGGQSGKPDVRTLKTAVKSLCQNGSAKQIKFSHRNKRGIMVTKTILAKADMATSNNVILDVQRRMIEADPRQYLPEALDVDSELKQDTERERSRPWPAVFEEQTVETSMTPAKVLRLQLRETLSRARATERATDTGGQKIDEANDLPSGNVVRPSRLGGIRRKYTTNSGPYQKPKLSTYRYPQPSLSKQPKQTLKALQFRTETLQVPLTFEALAPQNQKTPNPKAPIPSHSSTDASLGSQISSIRNTPPSKQVQPTTVVWKNISDQPVLPSSLEDILLYDRRRKRADYAKEKDPNYREFSWKIEGVARWEQRSFNLFDFKSTNYVFINHLVGKGFQAAPEPRSSLVFDGLIWYDKRGHGHTERRFHAFNQNILSSLGSSRHSDLQAQNQEAPGQTQRESVAARAPSKRKRDPTNAVEHTKKRRQTNPPLTQPQTIINSAGNRIDVSHLIGAKYQRPRGTQHLRTMPERLIYKLTVTVVVVRALAGGLEKHIDWPLVMCVFPDEDENFLKDRCKTLSNKHRREVDQISENFQDRFPDAYAKGEVPHIDFDDLESVDWESMVSWALNSLDKPVMHEIPDLPATRSEFDETVNMKIENSSRPYRDLFGYNQAVTIPIKEAAICAIPFAVPHLSQTASPVHPPHLHDATDDISDPELTLAKSWALSTISTPLDTYDAAQAHSKLQSLAPTAIESETLIKTAMQSITSAKAVAKMRDKAVDAKGRTFDLSRIFTDTLGQRRTINGAMLKKAVRYKTTVLDPAFERGEIARFQPTAVEDGDMVAILNLAAKGRIKITIGDDVPRNRWGVDPESRYKTRNIKKENLYFTVLIRQVPGKYIFGNPLLEHDVPIPDLGTGERDRIPIWRGIHGGFQRDMWDLAIAAVLGLLASRPGANVREVAKVMSPALGAWEVECLLAWCLDVGTVKKTGEDDEGGWTGGWEVREWWWMVLECGGIDTILEPGLKSALK